ncbi:DNA polymerase III subunit delta' [Rhodococcus sp. X156]|uniref:DNA polymerase III subunit delta' n=1 Tax=Rhodococcus sp. X156 TaxID=2499145 RepID=UPI000FD9719B|nr:DNA polymerase III subunit delta' [Rhodococcus sp. X156]
MSGVFDRLVGQQAVVDGLSAAATAARSATAAAGGDSAMTHAWLFTGPPGSGRSVAALCFAAALECTAPGEPGCGVCQACHTVQAGTHGDVRRVIPEGLTIGVAEMRAIVQIASRRPSTGRWQVVVVEDADRLTEGAANALLKVVEEPPPRTVFLLCAPSVDPQDISVTLRSRCRHVALRTPSADAIAQVLRERDGLEPERAQWAASVGGGHVGRARRLATDGDARQRRAAVLQIPHAATSPRTAYAAAEDLVAAAEAEAKAASAGRDAAETEEMRTALGAGGTGKGAVGALRGSAGVLKDLERRQKSRATRAQRDAMDRALVDLAGYYRDALARACGAQVSATHPDQADAVGQLVARSTPEGLLRCLEAVLACREALAANVKPRIAVDAMVATLGSAVR